MMTASFFMHPLLLLLLSAAYGPDCLSIKDPVRSSGLAYNLSNKEKRGCPESRNSPVCIRVHLMKPSGVYAMFRGFSTAVIFCIICLKRISFAGTLKQYN